MSIKKRCNLQLSTAQIDTVSWLFNNSIIATVSTDTSKPPVIAKTWGYQVVNVSLTHLDVILGRADIGIFTCNITIRDRKVDHDNGPNESAAANDTYDLDPVKEIDVIPSVGPPNEDHETSNDHIVVVAEGNLRSLTTHSNDAIHISILCLYTDDTEADRMQDIGVSIGCACTVIALLSSLIACGVKLYYKRTLQYATDSATATEMIAIM